MTPMYAAFERAAVTDRNRAFAERIAKRMVVYVERRLLAAERVLATTRMVDYAECRQRRDAKRERARTDV